ncbi:hypothetical protein KR018_011441 [Drosophila ironensis]|nr:hypothetical protein KR018_011441 [Drosophila ironensis]
MSKSCALSAVKTVLCVGCTEVDFVVTVENLDFDQEVNHSNARGSFKRSGRSANVSSVIRLLGAKVEFFGVLCALPMYRQILIDMESEGIESDNCQFTYESPPFTMILVDRWSRRSTVVYCDKPFPYVTEADFRKLDLNQYAWVNFEAIWTTETCGMIKMIQDHNNGREEEDRVIVSLQVNKNLKSATDLFLMCDYVLVSKFVCEEQGWMTARDACEGLDRSLRMPHDIKVRRPCFIVPWSSSGAACMSKEGNFFHLKPYKAKRIVDRVGDSDVFTAAFIYASLVRQRLLASAVDFGNAVASYKLGFRGFDCIKKLDIESLRLPVVMEGVDISDDDDDDEDVEDQQRRCKKYLFRPSVFRGPSQASSATLLPEKDPPHKSVLKK